MTARASVALLLCLPLAAAAKPSGEPPVVRRWNLTVGGPRGPYPSWIEVTPSGFSATRPGQGRAPSSAALGCATADSAAAMAAVRARLGEWVRQTNGGDRVGADEVWAPGLVGWFPSASLFADSAARAAAGVVPSPQPPRPRTTFDVVVDDIVASGSVVVVHDVWTETREFASPGGAVQRVIRGSELWRCQPDGRWRIARYVSAPEPWTVSRDLRK